MRLHLRPMFPRLARLRPGNVFFLSLAFASALGAQEAPPTQAPLASAPVVRQDTLREPPVWWFGGAGAANLNFYWGTTQQLNSDFATPAPFHKGFGAGLYLAPVVEYRPGPVWGGILQIGYDDRRGDFYDVPCPCGENSTLSAKPSYLSVEPSLRVAPFAGAFYLFAGPRIAYRWSATGEEESFVFTREGVGATKENFSAMRPVVFSGQFGLGYDIALNDENARTRVNLAPFASYQPHFGQDPRDEENWAISTLRVGAALKFGRGKILSAGDAGVRFSVRAPKGGASRRRVQEAFPLRNYVFFNEGSTDLPDRYVALTPAEAAEFREEQLQDVKPKSLKGRSRRQMTVYHNVLNTVGDRMRRNPGTSILLTGASEQGADHGKARAESVKRYLVNVYGIDAARISTEGRAPAPAAEPTGGSGDAALLLAGRQRVEITSRSPEMLAQVGTSQDDLKPVRLVGPVEEPQDSVIFTVAGAGEAFTSWSLEITDDAGAQRRFGPYTEFRAALPQNAILRDRAMGDYKAVMVGQSRDGTVVRKEAPLRLTRQREGIQEVVRFTILFDFGQTKTVASYEKFLIEAVAPLISDSSVVVISGHTDLVGDDAFNSGLARERAQGAQAILEKAVAAADKRGVTFETAGYGEDTEHAPFENELPEERAYNRTVILDILPR